MQPFGGQLAQLAEIRTLFSSHVAPFVGASRVALFGSCANGLWTRNSDIDLTFIVPACNAKVKTITKLRVIRDFLDKSTKHNFEFLPIVENARIPVLKVKYLKGPPLWVDVSINNISGVENTKLVETWCRMDSRFAPLYHRIKQWATERNINDRATGTLSTYTLLLQLVYVFQTLGIFPLFSTYQKSPDLQSFDELNGIERELPFGVPVVVRKDSYSEEFILKHFFEIFSNFENGAEIIDGTVYPSDMNTLIMRCPLTGKDVNTMNSATWAKIHLEFARRSEATPA